MQTAPTTEELVMRLEAGRRLRPLKPRQLRAVITEMYRRSKRAYNDAKRHKNYGGLAHAYRNISMIAKAISQAMPDDSTVQTQMRAVLQAHGRAQTEADIARLIMTPTQRAVLDAAINGAMGRGAISEAKQPTTGGQRRTRATSRVLPTGTRTRSAGGGSRAAA